MRSDISIWSDLTTDQAVQPEHTTIPAPPQNVVISGLLIVMVMVSQ